jgi:aminocarboxymuconate-semialdehyde decarboxylase
MPIDVHAHYVPTRLFERIDALGPDLGVTTIAGRTPALSFAYGFKTRPFFPALIEDVAKRRAWLGEKGLDRQIVAVWPDMYGYGFAEDKAVGWHKLVNDELAAWTDENADAFSWVASVPLPHAEAAAAALERAAASGAVGVMVATNVEGVNLGELPLDPFWAKAQALNLTVLLHPVLVDAAPRAAKFALAQIAHYTFDTTMGLGSLIFSGVLDRFPRLSLFVSHGGGAFPYLAGRFDIMHARMDRAAQSDVALQPPSAYMDRMAFDTIVHGPKPLRFLAESVGVRNMMLGTDYSFPPADLDPLASLREAGFSKNDITAIADENPRRLFPTIR